MAQEKHPFDRVAEQLEAAADRPVAGREASPDYWELRSATDASVGDYPQAVIPDDVPTGWGESEGLGPDGFPAVLIPDQRLQATARWTDVLSSNLWSEGFLLNDKALAVFRGCDLGAAREYPAVVRDTKGVARALTYLHVRNPVAPTAIDFARSEFYVVDMLGTPIRGPLEVRSFDAWQEMSSRALEGQLDGCRRFSRLQYTRLTFLPGHRPSADCFMLTRLGVTVYISARLKDAIVGSGITGLEIKPNRRLFVD